MPDECGHPSIIRNSVVAIKRWTEILLPLIIIIYIYIYITNCRQYCFGLLGLYIYLLFSIYVICVHIMDAEIHCTATCVCMFINYQQTQSQWPWSRGPVRKLAFQCNAIDKQSTQCCNPLYILGKTEICPTAQKNHDNKLHSSHLDQMIKAVFLPMVWQQSLNLSSLVLQSESKCIILTYVVVPLISPCHNHAFLPFVFHFQQ